MNAGIRFDKPHAIILSHQRSGTHFLEGSLASHPMVIKRSECVLRYKLHGEDPDLCKQYIESFTFINFPHRLNLAIVMYDEVEMFEKLCGSLFNCKVIHLVRDAESVAKSIVQRIANARKYGENHRAHYMVWDENPPNVEFNLSEVHAVKRLVESKQQYYLRLMKRHKDAYLVQYEKLTRNKQLNQLPKAFCQKILNFLGLEYHPLSNNFRKTGLS